MSKLNCSLVAIGALLFVNGSIAGPAQDDQQKAVQQIQAAYDAGQGKCAYLHWPSKWVVDEQAIHYSRKVKDIGLKGNTALVTSYQDESVMATDPQTGKKHFIRYAETFKDRWKHTQKGWFLKKSAQVITKDNEFG